MRKYKLRPGKFSNIDLAMAIHDALDLPMDKIQHEPKIGMLIVRTILKAMASALISGQTVAIKGFGKFTVRPARQIYKKNTVIYAEYKDGKLTNRVISHEPRLVRDNQRISFLPSIQLMGMINQDTPNFKEHRAIDTWNDE